MEAVPPWGPGTKSHWFLELRQLARGTRPGHEPLPPAFMSGTCDHLPAGQVASQSPSLICGRCTLVSSRVASMVSSIVPASLGTYPCRPRLPCGHSGPTLRTTWSGIMQMTELEGAWEGFPEEVAFVWS